jgi:RNA polymerase sigma factor (sigma-70 family)
VNRLTDQQLLREYIEHRSDPAFAELVRRYVDFVYSAARRMVRDAHLAEDVTQAVFLALAQQGPRLSDRPVLSGWLHRTAQNLAANAVRYEVRRRAREQEAAAMNDLLSPETDPVWEHVSPHLDSVLGELSAVDREALLRYFQKKSAHEIAQVFGISDEAAQKRVSRAVDRLRAFLAKGGIAVGASGLVAAISANAVQAAPVGLSAAITTSAALAGATTLGAAAATTTQTIVMTTLQKAIIGGTLAVAVGTGIYETRQASQLRERLQTLQQHLAPLSEQIEQLRQERDEGARQFASLREQNERLNRDLADLLKLRGEVSRLRAESQELAQSKAENSSDPMASIAAFWMERVNSLSQRLDQVPDIPELQYLTEQDWFDAAREADLETDDGSARRSAACALRPKAILLGCCQEH